MTKRSRLDVGVFTVADIQTMGRYVGVDVDMLRRLTELALEIARLKERPPSLREAVQAVQVRS